MKKSKRLVIIVVLMIVVVISSIFYSNKNHGNDIEDTIDTALRIQYGWKNTGALKEICTEEFVETTDLDEVYMGRKFYSIDKDYMENVRKISDNEIEISVNVYSPDIMIHKFKLTNVGNDKYLISGIEHDI